MDPAGCVQMAEEALPAQLSHLRGGFLTPRHHRPGPLAVERGEAAAHGDYPGVSATGSAPTGAAASGAGRSPQLTASQPRGQLSSG
ncbi:hypothetical protein E2320_009501 [Naja naja]|nr:hypothetical protein E2320_009501 [Naja naja]